MKKNSGFIQLPVIAVAVLLLAAVALPVISNFVASNKKITTQQRAAMPVCSEDYFLTSNCDGQCLSSQRCILKIVNPKTYQCCTIIAASCNTLITKIQASMSKRCGEVGYDKVADINKDGLIDVLDLQTVAGSGGSGGDETYCAARLADISDPCTSSICDLDKYLANNCEGLCTGLQVCLLKGTNPKNYQCCTVVGGTPTATPTIQLTVTPLPTGCHGSCRSDCRAAVCPAGKIVGLPCACSSACTAASCSSGCSGTSASCYDNNATWETHICCVNPPPSLTPTPIPSPGCTGSCNSTCTAAACPVGKSIGGTGCVVATCLQSQCGGEIATCSKSGTSGWTTSICCVGPTLTSSPTPTATPGTTGSCTGGCYGSITNCSTNCNYGRTACTQLSNTEVQSVCGWPSGSIGFCCKVGPVATATPGGASPTAAPRATLTPVASVTPGGATPTGVPARCICPADMAKKAIGNANCDNMIGIDDYALWRSQWEDHGMPVSTANGSADFDCSGLVDIADYALWFSNTSIWAH